MNKKQLIVGMVALAALAALLAWGRERIHFDFAVFRSQIALADWKRMGLGVACIYVGYLFRSARWAYLLRHTKKVAPLSLTGTQVMGFTAVALIGRVADPVRPYLVTRRTGVPLSTQIAVYIVERLFDFGSLAVIISLALLWIPYPQTAAATAHSNLMARWLAPLLQHSPVLGTIVTRFGALLLTVAAVLVLVVVRLSGLTVARFFERGLGPIAHDLGHSIGHKIRTFHSGLGAIQTLADFGIATALSLLMWGLITTAYLETARAFVASPALAGLSIPKCILLMAVSGGVSIVQLPILGWFSQIAFVAAALVSFFGASPEAATACAASLLLVTFLSVIPVGLIWAQAEDVSLRKVTAESELAEEELAVQQTGAPAAGQG